MADAALDSQTRPLITPEGVDLKVRIATAGERAIAVIIDLVIMLVVLIVATIIAAAAGGGAGNRASGQAAQIIWLLGFFLLRNFYFTWFEASARGATLGKRIMGLRVAARNGGALRVDSIVTRNAMRELELWLPMAFLLQRGGDVGAFIVLAGVLWSAVFVLFPLFNRDRLRLGDIIAGTWVIKAPKHVLLPDLTSSTEPLRAFAFSEKQLDVYGVMELQVLEAVLRNADTPAMEAVADRIRAKIAWTRGFMEDDKAFLSAYYAALRRRLEQRLLFGVRKRDKHDTR